VTSRTPYDATVVSREVLTEHLVRLVLEVPEGFTSSGVPDEWLALTVPGQFQTRYYTVRALEGRRLVLDVVLHDEGLVTTWARTDCVGDVVGLGEPRGSFALPPDAGWVVLAGDLTAMPAMARILETVDLPLTIHAEVPDGPMPDYLPHGDVHWHEPVEGESRLAEVVRAHGWPDGPGYFWMAGESAQMRDVRRHVRHDLGWDNRHHEAMGYWSASRGRAVRKVDPGPIYARGKAQGKSDEEIWADYDQARGTG
jgi:NADPH-dependent ferric siderophore reductase